MGPPGPGRRHSSWPLVALVFFFCPLRALLETICKRIAASSTKVGDGFFEFLGSESFEFPECTCNIVAASSFLGPC